MRPVDVYFKQYNAVFAGATQIVLLSILSVVFYFGLTGVLWTIPFPHLNFLGNYNGYFNWASFMIAGLMFYWYRQSALLSYFMLVLLFSISYSVTLIEAGHTPGLIPTHFVYLAVLIAALFGLVKMTSKRDLNFFKALLFVPLWLAHFITGRLNIKY